MSDDHDRRRLVESPSTGGSNPVSPSDRKSPHPTGLNARSCVTCRRRKVKCDKQDPCSNCTKAHTHCVFPAPGRAPRRPREGSKPVSEREAQLLKRLRKLEGVVQELSGQTGSEQSPRGDGSANEPHETGVRVVGMDEGSKTTSIQGLPKAAKKLDGAMGALTLDEGKSQYVSHPFWAAITTEVEEMREILEDRDFPTDDEHFHSQPSPQHVINDTSHQSFIMGYSSSNVSLKRIHPLPSQIPFYWQKYLENVDPLVKITHTPTMNKVIREVQNKLDSLSAGTEALMFSIYLSTIISMSPEDVQNDLGQERDLLLKQYRFGVEQALARANFLNTNEIVTVQALVLFLTCVRRLDDTRFVWSLTALALRIAQSLGLHRDGSKFGLSPFDTEMRRRLWGQICILDTRAAEDYGSEPIIFDQIFDTEVALNIDDCDLDPEATEAPTPKSGLSEMSFCLIRYEICNLMRNLNHFSTGKASCPKMGPQLTVEDKERVIQEFSGRIEDKYLKHCHDDGPRIYWVAATIARLITAKMRLMIYHPWAKPGSSDLLPQVLKDSMFMSSIEIMEYTHILKSEPSVKHWLWLFQTYTQWYCIAYILGELASRDSSIVVDRAWRTIENEMKNWSDALSKTNPGMLWGPMRKLLAKAKRRRDENASKPAQPWTLGVDIPVPPPSGPKAPLSEEELLKEKLARDIFIAQMNGSMYPTNTQYTDSPTTSNISVEMVTPQNVGMFPMPMPMTDSIPEMPWLMGNEALQGADIQGSDGDMNWDGWGDLVRDFQIESESGQTGEMTDVSFGAMKTWW